MAQRTRRIKIQVKRIYDPPSAADGFRMLVDRLWPRGVTKKAAQLDQWAKELAPSAALRQRFHADPSRAVEFAREYRRELAANRKVIEAIFAEIDAPVVTLLTATKDPGAGHTEVLKRFLGAGRKGK